MRFVHVPAHFTQKHTVDEYVKVITTAELALPFSPIATHRAPLAALIIPVYVCEVDGIALAKASGASDESHALLVLTVI